MGKRNGSLGVARATAIAALLAAGCGALQVADDPRRPEGTAGADPEAMSSHAEKGHASRPPQTGPGSAASAGSSATPAPPAGPVGRLPPEPGSTPPLDESSRTGLRDFAASLRNAAVRDHELESQIRTYLGVSRGIFANFRSAQGGAGKQGVYDPEALPEIHLRLASDLTELSARAVILADALRAIADASGIDLDRPGPLGGRGERLQLYVTLLGCIRDDTQRRVVHGKTIGGLLSSGRVDAFSDPEAAELMRREVAMLRETMRCTSLAARRNPPDDRG